MSAVIRPVRLDDAEEIAELRLANREFLAPWEPERAEDFFHLDHQRQIIENALDETAGGRLAMFVICAPDGKIAGTLSLNGITRGALQSASVGYWVRADRTGRGLATSAVRAAMSHAFDELRLHRLEAATLLHNAASQQVLRKSGFRPFGVAPRLLKIAGRWQDHLLFHVFATESDD